MVAVNSESGDLARISKGGKQRKEEEVVSKINEERQDYEKMAYTAYKEMCPELNALELTLKRQDVCRDDTLRSVVMNKIREPDFDLKQLMEWASGLLKEFGLKKDIEERALAGLDPEFLTYVGLGSCPLTQPKEREDKRLELTGPSRKQAVLKDLDNRPKRLTLGGPYIEAEGDVDGDDIYLGSRNKEKFSTNGDYTETGPTLLNQIENIGEISISEAWEFELQSSLNQISISEGETPRNVKENRQASQGQLRRAWSWKREARRRGRRDEQRRAEEAGEPSNGTRSRRQLDFY